MTIEWQRVKGKRLTYYATPRGEYWGLREEDLVPVAEWCAASNCGKRVSFNQFQFKTAQQVVMFMLRWG